MKPFLEVFHGLRLANQMEELLGLVEVEKVSMSRDRGSIRIFIISPRLIHKKNIMDLEKGIRDQLFPGKRVQIKIMEKYRLSGQYTPEKLLQAYRDSLLMELKHYSIVEYGMLRKAKCRFPQPDLLCMSVEDTMVNKEKAGDLKRVLEKVFHERCGLPVEVAFTYIPAAKTEAAAGRGGLAWQQESRMSPQALPALGQTMAGAAAAASPGAGAKKETAGRDHGAGSAANNGAASGGARKNGIKKGDWSERGGYRAKKSDNPDVLFGRDFEDDFIEIDKIEGEVGQVTVRGKVLDKESRLLRSGKTIIIFHLTDFTDTITVKMFADEGSLEDMDKAVAPGGALSACRGWPP